MALFLNAVCIILLLLTPLSYFPQCRTLFVVRSTDGISVTAALILALCAQSQMATMYYLWACPPFKRDGDVVPKPPLFLDYVNLAQLMIQWICSILDLMFLVMNHRRFGVWSGSRPATTADAEDVDINNPSQKTIVTLIISHLSLCIFWAVLAGKPTRDWLDLPFVTIMGINQYVINPLITLMTFVAFIFQASMSIKYESSAALNRMGVLSQAVVFLALAVSWPLRFKVPPNRPLLYPEWLFEEWYPLVGWTCINSAIIAIGEFIVLYVSYTSVASRREYSGERQVLLET